MNSQSYSTRFQLKAAPMVVGAVLLGTGAMVGMAGLIVGGTAVLSGARKWFMEVGEQARQAAEAEWGKQPKVMMPSGSRAMAGNGMPARTGHA